MKTTKRFDNAIKKLYTAFHEGTLDAMDCEHCAVGNIVGHGDWHMHFCNGIEIGNKPRKIYCGLYLAPKSKDYNKKELERLEFVFLCEWAKAESNNGFDKDIQFKGLCAVVKYLAELDNIPNPMDYTKLFEIENNKPKYELI